MATRELSWLALVQQADPDHARTARYVIEYEFTAYGRGDERTHENGMRVFRGNYDVRGPYTPVVLSAGTMTWNGVPLMVGDQNLNWDD
jgi:hypothetical protein